MKTIRTLPWITLCFATFLHANAAPPDQPSITSQHLAVLRDGDVRRLREALDRGLPVNARDSYGNTPLMCEGELKMIEADLQPVFHPDPAGTKGYMLLGMAAADLPATEFIDSWVHHLAVIQGEDGRWYNNLPRPPLQTSDVAATALAVQALQHYALPGRKAEFADRVDRARQWLWTVKPQNTEERAYQILGLAWAGEPARRLQSLAKALVAEQRPDGGWSQLSTLKSDAYATGQTIYALRMGAGLPATHPTIDRGRRYLLETQLEDGTWYGPASRVSISADDGQRFPARTRRLDFCGGDQLGGDGAEFAG